MGPDLIKTWEERLQFTDRVWEAKGLKGGEGAPQYASIGMNAYRNETEPGDGWGGFNENEIQHIPITFSAMNTLEAQLLARDPQFSLYARNEAGAENASTVETIVNYYVYELRFRRQWKRALKDANLVSGFGIAWHGYTPLIRKVKYNRKGEGQRLIEYYDPAKPDVPWIRRIAPWDVRIDPTGSSFHPEEDAGWCARRILMNEEQYADDPMFARINVQPTYSWDLRAMRPHIRRAGEEGPDLPKMLEIWEFYDKVNEIMFHLSPGASGKILTKDGERPWPDGVPKEGLPYSYLAFNEQPDDVFPISYESMIRDQQIELNKLRTMMSELTKRLRRVIMYRRDLMGEGEADRIIEDIGLKEWVEAQGGDLDNIIKEITLGTFPQELLLYEARIIEGIRETLGQSKFQRAQRENVESATEAERIGMGDDTQIGRNQAVMEEFITDTVRKWHQGFRAVATDDIIIPMMDESDARQLDRMTPEPYLRATPKQIQGEYLFKIKLGSTRPTNEQQEKQEALMLLQTVQPFADRVLLDQHLVEMYRAFNKSPRRFLLNMQEMKQSGAAIPQMGGNGQERRTQTIDPNLMSLIAKGQI